MTRRPLLLVFTLIAGAGISLAAGQSPTSSAADQGAGTNDKPKEHWDITQSLGPSKPLDFETAEGTWMNVDVSPDGRQIVFDLLGDLYVMPVGGQRQRAGRTPDERRRPSTCSRASAPTANRSRSRAIATGCGTSG